MSEPRDPGPTPWPTEATGAPRALTVREEALAVVQVNHLGDLGYIDCDRTEADVDAVLAVVGERQRTVVLRARHAGYGSCLRAVLEEIEELDALEGHDPAAKLAHLRQGLRERLDAWQDGKEQL